MVQDSVVRFTASRWAFTPGPNSRPKVKVVLLSVAAWIATALVAPPAPVSAADLQYPMSVAVSKEGTLYIADRNLPGIWKVSDGKLEVYFQASKKLRTPLNVVMCVAVDSKGRVVAGDPSTREIYRFNESGEPEPLSGGGIGIPMSIAFSPSGDILVADLELMRIVKVPAAGGAVTEVGKVPAPRGITVDSKGRVWVVSHGKDQIVRLNSEGKPEPVVRGRPFQFPHSIAIDPEGIVYVSDGYAKAIWKVDAEGKAEKWVEGDPFVNPVGIVWNAGRLLVADPRVPGILEVSAAGKVTKLEIK